MLPVGSAWAAQAQAAGRAPVPPFESMPMDNGDLAGIRGGFDLGNGLVASFGISRAIYINGDLVARVSINIPDVSQIDRKQAAALATLVNGATLIRNGPGNFVDPASFNRMAGAIVIQNTLDNQQIQALTTLDTRVRNLTQFSSLNIANTLQQALVNSRGQ
jgi:hypothetical protein